MSDQMTVGAIPWYESAVFKGAAVTVLSTIVSLGAHWIPKLAGVSQSEISDVVTQLFSLIALLSGIYTTMKRQGAPVQPLTLTKAAAQIHPATLVAKQVDQR